MRVAHRESYFSRCQRHSGEREGGRKIYGDRKDGEEKKEKEKGATNKREKSNERLKQDNKSPQRRGYVVRFRDIRNRWRARLCPMPAVRFDVGLDDSTGACKIAACEEDVSIQLRWH